MTYCVEPGCRRAPAYPDQARCREHRLRWVEPAREPFVPEWRRRLTAKDMTWRDAA